MEKIFLFHVLQLPSESLNFVLEFGGLRLVHVQLGRESLRTKRTQRCVVTYNAAVGVTCTRRSAHILQQDRQARLCQTNLFS